jgi:hypothetical protein
MKEDCLSSFDRHFDLVSVVVGFEPTTLGSLVDGATSCANAAAQVNFYFSNLILLNPSSTADTDVFV